MTSWQLTRVMAGSFILVMLLTMLWLTCATASAAPISVSDAWHSAMEHDPKFAAAQAQRDAGRARGAEGRALWLPTLSATGGVGLSDLDNRKGLSSPLRGSAAGMELISRPM